jgi:hypothetical protein
MLESIESVRLNAVVGGGLSLGNRDAPPPSDNSWAAPMAKHTFAPDGLSATIDPGMTKAPSNPGMDAGMWSLPGSTGGGGGGGGSGFDI